MEENLEIALQRLFGGKEAVARKAEPVEEVTVPSRDLAKEAMRIFERALDMQRQGNWAGYGEEIRKLEQILKKMAK